MIDCVYGTGVVSWVLILFRRRVDALNILRSVFRKGVVVSWGVLNVGLDVR